MQKHMKNLNSFAFSWLHKILQPYIYLLTSQIYALALASDFYDEKDFIRDYGVFTKMVANGEL